MSVVYNGAHSITFIEALDSDTDSTPTAYSSYKRSWRDFHLVPEKRPSVNPPSPALKLIDIPGTNRRIDMTDLMPGGLKFGRRQGEWQFILDHDLWDNWHVAKKTIEDTINGKRLYCILEDDFNTAYRGRFRVKGWQSGPNYSSIAISYDLEYKKYINVFRILDDVTENKMLSSWIEVDKMIQDGSYRNNIAIGDSCFIAIPGEYQGVMEVGGIDLDIDINDNEIPITWFSKYLLDHLYPLESRDYYCPAYYLSQLDGRLSRMYEQLIPRLRNMIISPKKSFSVYYGPPDTANDYTDNYRDEIVMESAKIWIPSHRELTGQSTYETIGCIYEEYFNTSNPNNESKRIRKRVRDDNASFWWTRTYEYIKGSSDTIPRLVNYYGVVDIYGWVGYANPPSKINWWNNEPGVLIGFCTGAST